MSNDKNKAQLIKLFLDQWKTDKYASRLTGRDVYYVAGEKVFHLTYEDEMMVSNYPEESLFSSQEEAATRIILHCLNARTSLPDAKTIVVSSPDMDVLVLLARYRKEVNLRI